MNQEKLNELKEKIGKLTELEKKQRDLYLRKLANGELQGPPVGYNSIDKPWLKYYTEEKLMEDAPLVSCYEYLYQNNKDYPNDIAIEYFGKKITYKELFENIDKAAQAYETIGVKKGDIVTICSITTPEIIYSFYALNKIGAISNMIDLRYTEKSIEKFLNEVKSKYCVILDLCYPKVKNIINNTHIEKVITVSPVDSAPKILKGISKMSDTIKGKKITIEDKKKYISWKDFIKQRKVVEIKSIPYVKNYPISIVHTGGTTGVPKGVLISNENINNVTIQTKNADVEAGRGFRFLNIMPPFIAYGIGLALNTPLTLGWYTIVIPKFDAKEFDKLLEKHKPNCIIGVPAYWESVMKSEKMKNADLSYVKTVLLGGDKIKPEFEKRLQSYLENHNCSSDVGKGYSMTEATAIATFSSKNANKLDSAGIPLSKTTVSVFEPGTEIELKPNEMGEIYIKSPTIMLEYYENPEETNKVKVKHADGYWIHSGDIGYVDNDGLVYPKDRIKRIIVRSGFKVFPSEIENLFMTHYAIESCAVVGIPDEIDVNAPIATIVLKEEYKGQETKIKEELLESFHNSVLPPYFEPVDFTFTDALPLTDIGKVDFKVLQKKLTK